MRSRRLSAWLSGIALASCLGLADASGAPAPVTNVEGVVMTVEGDDVIVDIGGTRGLAVGDRLELWRPLLVVHPVTRKRIRDRYRVGALKVVQVRQAMAVTTVEGALVRAPEAGDTVVWRRVPEPPAERRPSPPPRRKASPAEGAGEAWDSEAADIAALVDQLKDASLLERVRAYVAYIKEHPQSPYARLLREDAVQYHRLMRAAETPGAAPAAPCAASGVAMEAPPSIEALFEPPPHGVAGRTLPIAVQLSGRVSGAVLHVRPPGQVGFRSSPMRAAGPGFFEGRIRADQALAPKVEYFIEAIDPEGKPVAVVGVADHPLELDVESVPDPAPDKLQKLTTVSVLTDYADFNRLRRDDWTWQTEGTLGMRFADEGLRALRTGFGVYRGEGGAIEDLDQLGLEPRGVGLTYGYLEGEYAFTRTVALILRGATGLTEDGITGGGLGLVRIGDDQGTNIAVGGEFLGGVGLRSIAELGMKPMPRLPILLRSEVSNQPAGTSPERTGPVSPAVPSGGQSTEEGDLGLRSIVQVGYEILPRFVVSVRGSYQGRTIRHAGPGVGGAVSASW